MPRKREMNNEDECRSSGTMSVRGVNVRAVTVRGVGVRGCESARVSAKHNMRAPAPKRPARAHVRGVRVSGGGW